MDDCGRGPAIPPPFDSNEYTTIPCCKWLETNDTIYAYYILEYFEYIIHIILISWSVKKREKKRPTGPK